MAQRYIYDEVKQEFLDRGLILKPYVIIMAMKEITQNHYRCMAPGEVPEEKFDEFKELVIKEVEKVIPFIEHCNKTATIILKNRWW